MKEIRNIEVLGIGFPNKGAELMLSAVIERYLDKYPKRKLVLQTYQPYSERARYKSFQKLWFENRHFELGRLAEFLPAGIRSRLGLIPDSQIDVIFDCSGFAYGDQWGLRKAKNRLGRNVARWKNEGKVVILMPQAFGPFTDPSLKEEMRRILKSADLVFARDKESLKHLKSLGGDFSNVHLSPDITFGVTSRHNPKYAALAGRPCLIPNHKIIAKSSTTEAEYVEFFRNLVEEFQARSLSPFLLLHEGGEDLKLCRKIAEGAGVPVDIVAPNSPLSIKSVIGTSSFVVTSRFHGFVSSLSQGVPCAATSWSHKYEMLAGEFGRPEMVISQLNKDSAAMVAKQATDGAFLEQERGRLNVIAKERKAEVELFWKNIDRLVS
jgi:hypothetical protein